MRASPIWLLGMMIAAQAADAHASDDLRGRQSAGQFTVDEGAAAERALERTLVRAGALLLAPGEIEVEAALRYARAERATPYASGGGVAEARQVGDTVDAVLGLRVGLPWDAQAEISIPVSAVRRRIVTTSGGAPVAEDDNDGAGLGDVAFAVTKTLLHEDGLAPDLFLNLIYNSATGDDEGGIAFGSGFHEFGVGLTAVRRADPLVIVATAAYQRAVEDDGVRPGDQYALNLRAVLATSPTTSLRFGIDQTFVTHANVNGAEIPGTDQLVSSFVFGAAGALSRRTLLDFELGLGLTEDAPDYYLQAALPFRFSY